MAIDVIFAVIMAFAVYRGFTRGLIVAVFSLVAFVLGLAAALKLSAVLAAYLAQSGMQGRWWPVICFIVIFLAVVILVRLGAAALEKVVQWSMLGWVNRLGGILLYAAVFLVGYSVLLWLANQLYWLSPEVKLQSVTYPYIEHLGPKVMEQMGRILPVFRDVFAELEAFFERAAREMPVQ
ncbi:colicin V production protein [Chitinophaga alhagiae]|uniref:Colicin V production protein n=1 Tax=Chitinophaga alhagiae TaxID=2203219 RepID=A0ABM6WBL3_9BACT|nr:CvpA family protein [Chitinophaga alhagiae]AWO01222.1 colicin V production protein [Chitinophaga alhagiae]